MPIQRITDNISHCVCYRCERDWYSRVKKPVRCRHCGSPLWNTPYTTRSKNRLSTKGKPFRTNYNLNREKKRKNKLAELVAK